MRKFRAWHKENKTMIYFDPNKQDQYVDRHFYKLMHSDEANIMMQYTGMTDADGKDIYEGDLLDFYEGEWGGKFEPEQVPVMTAGDWQMCGTAGDVKNWRRVVGNVWEPPAA